MAEQQGGGKVTQPDRPGIDGERVLVAEPQIIAHQPDGGDDVADDQRVASSAKPEDALGRAGFEAAGRFNLLPASPGDEGPYRQRDGPGPASRDMCGEGGNGEPRANGEAGNKKGDGFEKQHCVSGIPDIMSGQADML